MKIKVTSINKHNNEYNVQRDDLYPLEIGKEYDFDIHGKLVYLRDAYELRYTNGKRVDDVAYPCGSAVDENGNKYGIFAIVKNKEFALFENVND